jgi:hypothetical protein
MRWCVQWKHCKVTSNRPCSRWGSGSTAPVPHQLLPQLHASVVAATAVDWAVGSSGGCQQNHHPVERGVSQRSNQHTAWCL